MKLKKYYKKYKEDKARGKDYFKWLYKYTRPYMWKIGILMLVSISMTYVSIEYAIASQKLIDMAGGGKITASAIAVFVTLMLVNMIVSMIVDMFTTMMNEKYTFGIRKQVFDKLLFSEWLGTQHFHTGDMMTRMTSDAGNVANGMVNVVPEIIVLIIQLIAVFFTLYVNSPFLAIFALFLTPGGVILAFIIGRKLKRLQIKVQESETAYRSFIQESLANILVVKAFSNEDIFSDKLVGLRENRFFWVWKKTKLSIGSNVVLNGTFQLGYMIAFVYAAGQIARGEITFGTMTLFLTLFGRVQAPIAALARQLPGVVSIFAAAGRIMDIQDIPLENRLESVEMKGAVGVEVSDVSFAYAKEEILHDVSFDIKPGEFVAIIGKSGIGKTTLIRVLMNFINAKKGTIEYFDEHGTRTEASASVREFVSYVPQGNTLFSGTIRDNVLMGKLDATEEEMWEALDMAVCREFIEKLPDGIDTVIGEKGVGISEGQAQRIALARALIRKSPFVILDEATSALDEQTEFELLQRLGELSPKPTCLLITHRTSVLKYCSRELMIDNGYVTMQDL
ncbi:ABC transporter ATP-binding protein [Butyrivibrio sp. FC2001]|uniref:ABC transporter ATP-binding protein n=1 Tax=Butyrivibrio sp. FC2001 TaxID=1280671 RepID=UPI000405A468|nr:ABC transporter ATP-binding protein [Butyrivibrio sp. FC2001]